LCEDHIGLQRHKFSREQLRLSACRGKAILDFHIVPFRPSKLFKPLSESRQAFLHFWIIFGEANQHADAPHCFSLLPLHQHGPANGRTDKTDKFPPSHARPQTISYRLNRPV
jgi:hypothetical protein